MLNIVARFLLFEQILNLKEILPLFNPLGASHAWADSVAV